jgi:hypothetical protein
MVIFLVRSKLKKLPSLGKGGADVQVQVHTHATLAIGLGGNVDGGFLDEHDVGILFPQAVCWSWESQLEWMLELSGAVASSGRKDNLSLKEARGPSHVPLTKCGRPVNVDER